ncbi:MAG: hypothetical protein R3C05_31070 [Pirellulaceae bacterium]
MKQRDGAASSRQFVLRRAESDYRLRHSGSDLVSGESNASRAYQYRDLFPLMIKSWREEWKQGDFPFYWVQLADFKNEVQQPGDSDWAELREAQTMTMDRLPNTGEAVIIDIGEGRDIHPRNSRMLHCDWPVGRSPTNMICRSSTKALAINQCKLMGVRSC